MSAPRTRELDDAAWLRATLALTRRVAAQSRPDAVARMLEEFLLDHVGDRAACLFHDGETGTSWSAIDEAREAERGIGLVGVAARERRALVVARVELDPRFDAAIDDPQGEGRGRLLVQPIQPLVGGEGEVQAVLVAARSPDQPAFDATTCRRLALLARQLITTFDQLALQIELDERDREPTPMPTLGPYRREALAANQRHRSHGDVARLSSAWLTWSYWGLVATVVLAIAYLCLAEVGQFASGVAMVRLDGRTEITALRSGSVVEVLVEPGARVEADAPLLRFHASEDAAELLRLDTEFELELRNLLRAPGDEAARRSVTSLRAQRERAAARVRDHVIRAPHAGQIRDVRVRPGRALGPGDVLMSLVGEQGEAHVLALLPGDERPRIHVGMPLRFEIDGYADAAQSLVVEHVDDDVVSPSEALRLLGPGVGEHLQLEGPVILVRARLEGERFESKRGHYRFHDGMPGRAEIRVRSTSVIEALIPALEELRGP